MSGQGYGTAEITPGTGRNVLELHEISLWGDYDTDGTAARNGGRSRSHEIQPEAVRRTSQAVCLHETCRVRDGNRSNDKENRDPGKGFCQGQTRSARDTGPETGCGPEARSPYALIHHICAPLPATLNQVIPCALISRNRTRWDKFFLLTSARSAKNFRPQ